MSMRSLVLLVGALTLTGAVTIAPRRDGPSEERPSAPAPAAPAPQAQPQAPGGGPRSRVRIGPRVAPSSPRDFSLPSSPARSGGFPSAAPSSSPRARVGIAPRQAAPPAPAATLDSPIRRLEGTHRTRGRHSWHTYGGRRYSHYYDGGAHWYGWYGGSRFYWTRPWGGYWWWYEPGYGRWNYWYAGHWWWPGPGGAAYIYMNDGYYPYGEPQAPAAPSVPAPGAGGAWTSPDGKRVVEVTGPDAQAVLYEKNGQELIYRGFLGKEVQRARFSAATPQAAATILIEFRDGTFALFGYDGRRVDAALPPAPEAAPPKGLVPAPPPPPDALPPAPPAP